MDPLQFCPILKLEKLLVATDRSVFSEGAIREAMTLAEKCASRIYIISVIESTVEYRTIGGNVVQKEEEDAAAYLESIKTRASKVGLHCESMLFHGDEPYRLIVDMAVEKMVGMIIMGRHGRTGLMKALMGSVTAKVIGHAPCKVLVVPMGAWIDYRNVLIATDGSEHSMAAASEAIEIVKRCGCRVIAISVAHSAAQLKKAETNVSRVVEMAQRDGIPVEGLTPIGKPHSVIGETADSKAVDLIVMGTYGESGLRKSLMGSTTEKVIDHAPFAVLVVKA